MMGPLDVIAAEVWQQSHARGSSRTSELVLPDRSTVADITVISLEGLCSSLLNFRPSSQAAPIAPPCSGHRATNPCSVLELSECGRMGADQVSPPSRD